MLLLRERPEEPLLVEFLFPPAPTFLVVNYSGTPVKGIRAAVCVIGGSEPGRTSRTGEG